MILAKEKNVAKKLRNKMKQQQKNLKNIITQMKQDADNANINEISVFLTDACCND